MNELNNTAELTHLRLEFDTPHFLQSLLAHDIKILNITDEILGVKSTSRDAWVLLSGKFEDCALVKNAFLDLEEAYRKGGNIEARDFRLALQAAQLGSEIGVSKIHRVKLVGSRGRKPVIPRSPNQLSYIEKIEKNDLTFGLGPAGTGKTYLAMAMALTMLKKKQVNRIILTRPAVEAGEALGFLPGDLKEKVAPYLRPLYDAMQDMLDPDEANKYMEDGVIEIAPLAFMRGRTLARSFVILDEAQNTTCEQMFMSLTRIGEGAKMVVTGDLSQIDLKHNIRSGLNEAQYALQNIEGIAFHTFEKSDIVRHSIVGRIVDAYEKSRDK